MTREEDIKGLFHASVISSFPGKPVRFGTNYMENETMFCFFLGFS